MGGFFGVASKTSCTNDLFFGIDYHSHLGTRRGGMAVYGEDGFHRSIHNIENSPFRTKFDGDLDELEGRMGIGCISDMDPQPLLIRSHHGSYALTTVGKINNVEELVNRAYERGNSHFMEMSRRDSGSGRKSCGRTSSGAGIRRRINVDSPDDAYRDILHEGSSGQNSGGDWQKGWRILCVL